MRIFSCNLVFYICIMGHFYKLLFFVLLPWCAWVHVYMCVPVCVHGWCLKNRRVGQNGSIKSKQTQSAACINNTELSYVKDRTACWPTTLVPHQGLHWASPSSLFQRRQCQPTPVLLPGESHGQRSLVGYSPLGRGESDTTEQLHLHFLLSCIGEGNGNPFQYSCLENPRDRGACWAAVYGVAQSQTRLMWLSSSSSSSSLFITGHLLWETRVRFTSCGYKTESRLFAKAW